MVDCRETSQNGSEPSDARKSPVGRESESEIYGGDCVIATVRPNSMNLHLRVRLIAIPTVLDGRRSAFTTGYRPQFCYRGRDNDVSVTIPDECLIEPGDSTDAF